MFTKTWYKQIKNKKRYPSLQRNFPEIQRLKTDCKQTETWGELGNKWVQHFGLLESLCQLPTLQCPSGPLILFGMMALKKRHVSTLKVEMENVWISDLTYLQRSAIYFSSSWICLNFHFLSYWGKALVLLSFGTFNSLRWKCHQDGKLSP